MASALVQSNKLNKDDDEDDVESLRLAALRTLGKKQPQPPPVQNVIFKPLVGNPNLIAIIPEGADFKDTAHKPVARQPFFRHPPMRNQPYRPPVPTTLKQLPQVHIKEEHGTAPTEKEENDEKEEVSTKFSRFEDIESESEDESETEKKDSESSDESEDVLALEDDDDSLEALMAQMEHEIEVGIDPEPSKKDKKKGKTIKTKEKETKFRLEERSNTEKVKSETKMAVVEPTFKETLESKNIKDEKNHDQRMSSPIPTKAMPPVKVHPLKTEKVIEYRATPINRITEDRTSIPQTKEKSPQKQSFYNSPHTNESSIVRVAVVKSRSPIERRSHSPRSPMSKSPYSRIPPSPKLRKSSLDRRSPLRRSQDRYYSRNKSPSPYYKLRDRDGGPVRRSRSPVRRRSMSPRKDLRNTSPRYYHRRSRSPWSPVRRPVPLPRSPSPRYRSRSPLRRHSLSPRNKKFVKSGYQHSPPFWSSPKRVSPTQSPRRSKSPRKREYTPKREYVYKRNSMSPKRKSSPHYKKYSSPTTSRSPKLKQRSPSPRRNLSPKRRMSPVIVKETRLQVNRKSRTRTPSLSLSPSPPRESKEPARRYKSPLRPRKEINENVTSRISRAKRGNSGDNKHSDGDARERRKPSNRVWDKGDKEGRHGARKTDDRRKDRTVKISKESKREKESNRTEKPKQEEPKQEPVSLKVTDNPVFEARRKKFESTAVVEPVGKKICLVSKKNSPTKEKNQIEEKKRPIIEDKKIVDNRENSAQTEDDLFSGRDEIDEIDNFLNEDVLDLSAEVWSSDDEIFPKLSTNKPKISKKAPIKQAAVKERISSKEKEEVKKLGSQVHTSPMEVKQHKSPSSPNSPVSKRSPEPVVEKDNTDLRAALRRRREERLSKAGSLHEKLPTRLLQSAFESALGTKKIKKEEKSQKREKASKSKESAQTSPVHKEKSDGRRVLVLKRPAPVRMQSAHINVTFPKDCDSDSETSYSSSSSEERYTVSSKRKLPVYMRLGTAQCKHSGGGRKVKLHSRRSQSTVSDGKQFTANGGMFVNKGYFATFIATEYKRLEIDLCRKYPERV